MQDVFSNILGFLPKKSVFWVALGTSLTIVIFQLVSKKLTQIIELPYMREENETLREKVQTKKQ